MLCEFTVPAFVGRTVRCRMLLHGLLALTTALLACCCSALQRPSVLPLLASDFEQKTQAATGQTTGVWCAQDNLRKKN